MWKLLPLLPFSCAVALALIFVCAGALGAEPGVWDVAREPRLVQDVAALREAQTVFLQSTSGNMSRERLLLVKAKQRLDKVDAAQSPDVRVRFFYGRLLSGLGHSQRAAQVIESALKMAPDHPATADAWFTLAVCYARLGRLDDERRAYERALMRQTSPRQRSTILSNMAESAMVQGRVDDATRLFERAISIAPDNVLAKWGLAVALDRSGDANAALQQAAHALSRDPDGAELDGPTVFFEPAYEKHWYQALRAMVHGNEAQNPRQQLVWFEYAEKKWRDYLQDALPFDPWLDVARARHARCVATVAAVRAKVPVQLKRSVQPAR